jgi:DUF1365 family protein
MRIVFSKLVSMRRNILALSPKCFQKSAYPGTLRRSELSWYMARSFSHSSDAHIKIVMKVPHEGIDICLKGTAYMLPYKLHPLSIYFFHDKRSGWGNT